VLEDRDPDVVRAAARSLAQMGAKDAVPDLKVGLTRFEWPETRRDIAEVLAKLDDPTGIPLLIAGLDLKDDPVRESYFETLFGLTGKHFCYEALAPREERLVGLANYQAWWAKEGGAQALRHPLKVDPKTRAEVKRITEQFGGSDGTVAAGDDVALRERLIELGPAAVPGLATIGLKYPAGFSEKRAKICEVLGELRHPDAVPALISALRDPVVAVAAWANQALAKIGDKTALPAVQRYHTRLLSLARSGRWPADAGSAEALLAQAASARFALGDARAEDDLVGFLPSEDESVRATALQTLRDRYGLEIEYEVGASRDDRRAAVEAWQNRKR
jgi:HEAT repeat protein